LRKPASLQAAWAGAMAIQPRQGGVILMIFCNLPATKIIYGKEGKPNEHQFLY